MKRTALGLSLGDVADRTRRRGEFIPAATMARIERGQADPGVIRLSSLLRLYDIPPQYALDIVEIHDVAGVDIPSGSLQTLFEEGKEAWKKGDLRRGLAYLHAIQNHPARSDEERLMSQKARLVFSTFANSLGRQKLAMNLLNELYAEKPHPSILFHALMHGALLWRKSGFLELAHALIDRAARHRNEADLQQAAWVHHTRAQLLDDEGDRDAARRELILAQEAYAAAGDFYGQLKARMNLLVSRLYASDPQALLAEAQAILAEATARGHAFVAADAQLHVGRFLIECGDIEGGISALRTTLVKAGEIRAGEYEFHAHYLLFKVYTARGEDELAQIELESARYFARFIEQPCPERTEVESMSSARRRQHEGRRKRKRRQDSS